jgi:hypothetical protein
VSRTTLSRASQAGAVPRDRVTGPRPHDCFNCTWAFVAGQLTLKLIHSGCPPHRDLPRAADGLASWQQRQARSALL